MKLVVILCFVAATSNYVSTADEVLSTVTDRILNVLGHQIPDILVVGKDSQDGKQLLPTKNTIHFETQHLDLCGPILCISANLTNAVLTGFAEYDVLKLDFHSAGATVTVDLDIFFPSLQLDAVYYEMEGAIMNALPLAGKGHLYYEATDFGLWTKIIMQVSDRTSIESFEDSGFSIKSILSRTEFDGNIDGIFNAMVEEMLADHLNRFNKAIAASCGAFLKDIINPYL